MENLKNFFIGIQPAVSQKVNIYVSVIVIFSYHFLFDKNFHTQCKGHQIYCWTYMLLPIFLIFILLLWMDRAFLRAWKFTLGTVKYKPKRTCNCHFGRVLFDHIFKALLVGLLWPVAALLDVDWYICCRCANTQKGKVCPQDSTEEQLNNLKAESKLWGLVVLAVVVILAVIVSSLKSRKKWEVVAGEMLLEEGKDPAKEHLRKAIKDVLNKQLAAHVEKVEWKKSFELAENLVIALSTKTKNPNERIEGLQRPYRQGNPQGNNNQRDEGFEWDQEGQQEPEEAPADLNRGGQGNNSVSMDDIQ